MFNLHASIGLFLFVLGGLYDARTSICKKPYTDSAFQRWLVLQYLIKINILKILQLGTKIK